MYPGEDRICGVRKVRRSFLGLTTHRMVSGEINCLFGVAEFRSLRTVQMELSFRLRVTWSRTPGELARGGQFSYGREWVTRRDGRGWAVVLQDSQHPRELGGRKASSINTAEGADADKAVA